MIFQKRRSFPVVLFIPEGFLALILRQFWHEHPYSMSYQRDQALFDSFKVPYQVVDAVNDTVWARELANLFTNKCLFTTLTGKHYEINLRPSRNCRLLSISSLEMTTFGLCIPMLCCDDTLRWSFGTCTSRCLVTVFGRSRLETIQWLVFCSSKILNFERMVLLFSRFFFFTEDSKYLCFNGAKKLSQSNISWWVKCYGNSTKHNWNVCCTRLLRLVLRTILLAHKAVFKFSISLKGSL